MLLLSNTNATVTRPVSTPDSHGWVGETYVGLVPPVVVPVSIQPQSELGNTSAARSDGYSAGPGDPGEAYDAIGYLDPARQLLPGDHLTTEEGETWLVRTIVLVRSPLDSSLDVKRLTLSLVTP